MAAYRATVHEATGYSPKFMMFGRELQAPIDLVLGGPVDASFADPDEFVEAVRLTQREACGIARDDLERRAERNKHGYDLRPSPPNLRLVIVSGIIIRGDMWTVAQMATKLYGSLPGGGCTVSGQRGNPKIQKGR